ncbi:pyruvate kinase, partial [Parvibaculum sp.]|uniref:pyruvate kinase n=2 Tax=Parvibaculum sp. TaxID=2024848 RepID=UPI00329A3464
MRPRTGVPPVTRRRNVKIIATLGPASDNPEMIRKLFDAGADVFRLNMSHLDHKNLKRVHAAVRQVEKEVERPIGILADLQGPKLRIGKMPEGGVMLEKDARFRLDTSQKTGDATRAHLPHPAIFDAVSAGQSLLLDDGKVRLRVTGKGRDHIETQVVVGGKLSSRKGVSVPDTVLPLAALTEKDRGDLDAALELGVDWVALSFVQRPDDVAEVRKIARGRAAVLAKIEKPQALAHLEEILEISDAIMVARGDLGVELPLEQVPGWQKRLTRAARRIGKPVVVATQMLESMISTPTPTRAEVSDVATA